MAATLRMAYPVGRSQANTMSDEDSLSDARVVRKLGRPRDPVRTLASLPARRRLGTAYRQQAARKEARTAGRWPFMPAPKAFNFSSLAASAGFADRRVPTHPALVLRTHQSGPAGTRHQSGGHGLAAAVLAAGPVGFFHFCETLGRVERYVVEMYLTMPNDTREQQLVEKARSGDDRAFEELCLGLRERLLATIRSRLGPTIRQGLDAEDVLQASFVRALHSIQRFEWRGDGSFRRWLESIAGHAALDAVRHHGRRATLRIDRELKGDGASPSKGLRRRERLDRLEGSMKALAPDYRTVLRLSRMDGLSIKEIANQMGRSESAVKNLLLRATKALRQSFGDTESLNLGDAHFEDMGTADGP